MEDMCMLYASSAPFCTRDLSILRVWCLWGIPWIESVQRIMIPHFVCIFYICGLHQSFASSFSCSTLFFLWMIKKFSRYQETLDYGCG
jgi:hypothetical protein